MVAEWENIGKKRFLTAKFDRIHLVKSTLTSSDPIYEILNSYPSKIE
jgi:2'-5' RNA ligase